MWILKGPKGETHYLVPKKEHVVGRKDGDVILADDQSISRRHAIISVDHPNENWGDPDKFPVVTITETGSKYGTVINPGNGSVKMSKTSSQRLNDGDTIQFGLQWNTWTLVHEPMVVVMSTLTGPQKREVKVIVGKLGGHIVNNWKDNCTHLTMSTFTMTVKAIVALAHGRAIVVPEFWKKFQEAIESKAEPPKYENFLPPLAETIINKNEVSFLIKPERRTLFQGKEFVFFTAQQFNEHACLVSAAGGTASILDLDKIPEKKLIEPQIIVMQHLSNPSCQISQTPHAFAEVMSFIQSHGKRVIPVSEIGLAILHCSAEKYCNPSFSFASTMLSINRNTASDLLSQQTLASETQETVTNQRNKRLKEKIVIPDSGTVSKPQSVSCKKENSEPTLLMDEKHLQKDQHVEKNVLLCERVSFLNSKPGSQKRPRNEDSDEDIGQQPKKTSLSKSKVSARSVRSKVPDDDDEGLFDFPNDKTRHDDEEEEDMFAFKESVPVDSEGAVHDTVLFPLQTAKNFEKDAMESLSTKDGQPASKVKRKLSSDEENHMSDRFYKKIALEDKPSTSNLPFDYGNSDPHENQDFIFATNIKKEKSENALNDGICNSTLVLVKPLVTPQPSIRETVNPEESMGQNIKNFKKFRKAHISRCSTIPHAIGVEDLVPYSKNSSAAISSLFNNDDFEDEENNDKDDWAFHTTGPTKKKEHSRRL